MSTTQPYIQEDAIVRGGGPKSDLIDLAIVAALLLGGYALGGLWGLAAGILLFVALLLLVSDEHLPDDYQ